MEPGWTLASLGVRRGGFMPSFPIMFDHHGDIRWYLDLTHLGGLVFTVERLANGNLLIGRGPRINEYDMLGNRVRQWPIPGYSSHHDVIEKKPGGNLIAAVDKDGIGTVEDHIIEIDRQTGAIVKVWDLREVLDPERTIYSGETVD